MIKTVAKVPNHERRDRTSSSLMHFPVSVFHTRTCVVREKEGLSNVKIRDNIRTAFDRI